MINTQTLVNFPVFGDNATKAQPDNAKYAAGFQPADVYPAEWVNWVWNKASGGVTALNAGVNMMEREINNVLDGADKTPDATKDNQLLEAIQKLISDAETRAKLAAHPVGSLYWSSQSTDPATLFGGTWARVKDRFILAAGDTYSNGNTGGSATVTLQTTQIPSHNHGMNSHTHTLTPSGSISGGAYTFSGNEHSHSYTPAGSISITTNPTFTGSSHSHSYTPAGTVQKHTHPVGTIATGSDGGHTHRLLVYTGGSRLVMSYSYAPNSDSSSVGSYYCLMGNGTSASFDVPDNSWTSKPAGGAETSGYARYGNWGTKSGGNPRTLVETGGAHTHTMSGSTGETQPTFTGTTATLTATQGGSISGGAYKFTGTSATLKATASGSITVSTNPTFSGSQGTTSQATGNTGSTGGGNSHENMPPYKVYYCWERTA